MQVTAYLDKDTGAIYGTEQELTDAQAERARLAAVAAAGEAASTARKDASTLLLRELTDVRLLPELFKRMLEAWLEDECLTMLARKKRIRTNFVKPAVHSLSVSEVVLRGAEKVYLRLRVAMTFSGTIIPGWSPNNAFPPFRYSGRSSCNTVQPDASSPPMGVYECDFQCDISKLPAFQQVVSQFSSLLVKQAAHDGEVDDLVEVALDANAQYTALRDAACAAYQALEEAKVAYRAAESAREQQEARVKAEVQASNPYAWSAELAKHSEAVGEVMEPTFLYLGITG